MNQIFKIFNKKKYYIPVFIIFIIFVIFVIFVISYNKLHESNKIIDTFDQNNKIPKIIIQTWKDNNIPDGYKNDIQSIKDLNPSYKYLFFTDEDIIYFLKNNYNEYYKIYLKLPVIIQKIDFFRYVAIYHYGGIYLDLDVTCLEPFDEILKYKAVFPVDQNFTEEKCEKSRYKHYCDIDQQFMVGQYAFAARPRDPFIKFLIDEIVDKIDDYIKLYPTFGKSLQYIYSTTGPDFVTDMYLIYPDKKDIEILFYDKDQYFGKYARHNYFGTWKNM
jgi:mannosyltransferase OCH1-like enzyme